MEKRFHLTLEGKLRDLRKFMKSELEEREFIAIFVLHTMLSLTNNNKKKHLK